MSGEPDPLEGDPSETSGNVEGQDESPEDDPPVPGLPDPDPRGFCDAVVDCAPFEMCVANQCTELETSHQFAVRSLACDDELRRTVVYRPRVSGAAAVRTKTRAGCPAEFPATWFPYDPSWEFMLTIEREVFEPATHTACPGAGPQYGGEWISVEPRNLCLQSGVLTDCVSGAEPFPVEMLDQVLVGNGIVLQFRETPPVIPTP